MWRNSKNTKKRENEIKHLRLKNRKAKQSVPETGKEEVEEIEGTQKGEGRDESENGRFDIGRESEKRHRYWNSSNRRRSSCAIVVGLEERK